MHFSVRSRIWGLVGLCVAALLFSGSAYIASERHSLLAEKKLKTRQLIEVAMGSVRHYHALSSAGKIPEATAQLAALNAVRALRYGGQEYFWIQDAHEPVMIMHATQPRLDGQRLDIPSMPLVSSLQAGNNPEAALERIDTPITLVIAANHLANTAGSGFLSYDWPRMTDSGPTEKRFPKLSFVEKFPPWNWVIGTGIFIDDIDQAVRAKLLQHLGLLAAIGSLLVVAATLLARSVLSPLIAATRQLHAMHAGQMPLAEIAHGGHDEIGELIGSYNQLLNQLKEREARLHLAASVFDNAMEGIIITDANANIIQVNPSFTRITGFTPEEVIGRNPRLLASGKTDRATYQEMWKSLQEGHPWQGELVNRRKDASEFIEQASFAPVLAEDGSIMHYIGVIQDITEQKEQARQLEEEAHRDYLTGLANRRYFIRHAEIELAKARRYRSCFTIAMLDLDHFKTVNDTYGHETGDEVLKVLAKTCLDILRDSDFIGRMGGEEFAILFPVLSANQAFEVVERLRLAISRTRIPLPDGGELHFTASFGIAELASADRNIDHLLARADQALYLAKDAGRNASAIAPDPDFVDGVHGITESSSPTLSTAPDLPNQDFSSPAS